MRTLMWFRNDLRTVDNTALHHAAQAGQVVGVFLLCRDQWVEHKWGDNKIDFVLRCVAALSDDLVKLNIPLRLVDVGTFDGSTDALLELADEHDCRALRYNIEYEVNERRRDEQVAAAFARRGLEVHAHHDQTIVPPDVLQTGSGNFYSVFTPFKKIWLQHVEDGDIIRTRDAPAKQAALDIQSDEVPEAPTLVDRWPGGQHEAQRRLDQFVKNTIDDYHQQRDLPDVDGTSRLSPYLACGAISPRQCWAAATRNTAGRIDRRRKGPATWLSELIWREFYRHVLVGFARVSMNQPFRGDTRNVPWRDSDKDFDAWREGRTGIPIVDAAMRQLKTTGWMHNRLRMIVAMFLTKNLLIHWRRGEDHFMTHLVDGDLASNNGGWQWSASTGTDAAPYFRIFNPVTQSRRFDPDGGFIRHFVPELVDVDAPEIHDPAPLTRSACDYPEMIVDLKTSRQRAIDTFKRNT